MSDWIMMLENRATSTFAIGKCEYCGRKARYDMECEFYCLSCGAPLPDAPELQLKTEQHHSPYGLDGLDKCYAVWS